MKAMTGVLKVMNQDVYDAMIRTAKEARYKSYSPYSKVKVGACALTSDGTLYGACNVENSSLSLSMCAERSAVCKAIADGKLEFDAVAVVADTMDPFVPCGCCCQVMSEFNIPEVVMANLDGDIRVMQLQELAPYAINMGTNKIKE